MLGREVDCQRLLNKQFACMTMLSFQLLLNLVRLPLWKNTLAVLTNDPPQLSGFFSWFFFFVLVPVHWLYL